MFKLGDVVEVQDTNGHWYEAMITEVSADGYKILWTFSDSAQFIAPEKVRATTPWIMSMSVQGMRDDNRWYDGTISAVNADGTYNIAYADGETGTSVPTERIHGERKVKRKRKGAGGGGGGGGSVASSGDGDSQACVPSHWTRCGANCFDLQNDRYNCGGCGRACPHGMGLCNHGQCDCTEYDKSANGGVCPN